MWKDWCYHIKFLRVIKSQKLYKLKWISHWTISEQNNNIGREDIEDIK